VNSLSRTVILQRRGCDLNPGPIAPESSMLTTRLPSHPRPLERPVYVGIGQVNKSICRRDAAGHLIIIIIAMTIFMVLSS